ncbi:Fatty acid hydroxylase family (carotene hydroxylase/sterol desaturase), partial [hydrothermal vent metagenome]
MCVLLLKLKGIQVNKDTFQVMIFFGGLILMFCIETLFSARKWEQGRGKRLCFHLGLSIFNGIILRFPVMIPLIMWQQFVYDKGWGIAPLLGLVGPMEIGIGFIVLDFFDYIWHRINHEIPFLWRFHKVHHVDTHVDVTTALRFHPGELVLSSIMKSLWILVWGPSLWAFAIF